MKSMIHKTALAATLGAMMIGSAFAQAAAALPPVSKSGPVEYLSGGIGQDEAKVIATASARRSCRCVCAARGRAMKHEPNSSLSPDSACLRSAPSCWRS